jgi:hypothetical protein
MYPMKFMRRRTFGLAVGAVSVMASGTAASLDADAVMIAFEDLPYSNSDLDYQDLVVIVQGVTGSNPVPEPTAALLFGAGLLVISRRRAS